MQDKCIRQDSCQNFLCKFKHRTPSRKVSNQVLQSHPHESPQSSHGIPGTMIPHLVTKNGLRYFYNLGFPTEDQSHKAALTMYHSVIIHDRHLRTQGKYRFYFLSPLSVI